LKRFFNVPILFRTHGECALTRGTAMAKKATYNFRSSKSGQFVTPKKAAKSPSTHEKEKRKK